MRRDCDVCLTRRTTVTIPALRTALTSTTREVETLPPTVLASSVFERGYLELLMGIGESDAVARHDELVEFFGGRRATRISPLSRRQIERAL